MKRIILLVLFLSFVPSANAQLLRGLFGGRRQQVQQVQVAQCYQQPTYQYQQAVNYQVVAAVPLATVPVAIDLQAYAYSVNAGAFQSFRDYQIAKNSSAAPSAGQPTETSPPVSPRLASAPEDDRLAGAVVLKKNCIGCHQAGRNPKSNFSIFDNSGNLYTSLPWTDILERISEHDPERRMPPKKQLPIADMTSIFRTATSLASEKQTKVAESAPISNPFE